MAFFSSEIFISEWTLDLRTYCQTPNLVICIISFVTNGLWGIVDHYNISLPFNKVSIYNINKRKFTTQTEDGCAELKGCHHKTKDGFHKNKNGHHQNGCWAPNIVQRMITTKLEGVLHPPPHQIKSRDSIKWRMGKENYGWMVGFSAKKFS